MDFTNLSGLHSNMCLKNQLNLDNTHLRNSIYIHFSNTDTLQTLFVDIVSRFRKFVDKYIINVDTSQDFLYSLFSAKELNKHHLEQEKKRNIVKIHIISRPLFSTLNIAPELRNPMRTIGALRMKEIGYQHLHLLHPASDSSDNNSNTDETDSDAGILEDLPIAKKLKTCERNININNDSMFKHHKSNHTKINDNKVHVDILIFVDKSVCKLLAEYLGLVYLEDLLLDITQDDIADIILQLKKNDNRLSRVLQSYINKKLIFGNNNICLIHTLELWDKISANTRAVISNGRDPLDYVKAIKDTHFFVELNENHTIMDYVESIALILDNALHCDTSVYVRCRFEGDVKFVKVKVPLTVIIPLHVMRYFAQSAIIEKKSIFDVCSK